LLLHLPESFRIFGWKINGAVGEVIEDAAGANGDDRPDNARHASTLTPAIFNLLPPALTGVRVLDLSTVVAGPTASMILADLGADIIKVERIDGGDDARNMGPHRGEWGAYFVPLNRGKRSIAIDITKPGGREIVLRLGG
jgi:hypothetical protein